MRGKPMIFFVLMLAWCLASMTACEKPDAGDDDDDDFSSYADDDTDDNDDDVSTKEGLHRCQDCEEVLEWIQRGLILQAQRAIDENYENAVDWYGQGWWDDDVDDDVAWDDDGWDDDAWDDDGDDDVPVNDDDQAGDDDEADNDDDYSDTNVQETGVDEADIVKTDGEMLYLLAGGNLMLFDPVPAGETHELSRLEIEGQTLEMFIYDGLVVVFSMTDPGQLPEDVWPGVSRDSLYWNILLLTFVDTSDPAHPSVIRKLYLEGAYLQSRLIDNLMRLVINTDPMNLDYNTWIDPWPYVQGGELDEQAMRAAYDNLMNQIRQQITSMTLDDWLPRYFDITGQGSDAGFISECEDYFRPDDPMGHSVSTVMTVNLDAPLTKLPDVALLADGQMIYASTEALYIANTADTWIEWSNTDNLQKSWIHKFVLKGEQIQVEYTASGEIPGFILNQFSMSEKDGYLRVAASTGWWSDLRNYIHVLKDVDGDLEVFGQIDGVAPGEEIKSARFIGHKGYLVTFEQTDPLFTIDLSNPADPQIVGELAIPGFSTYIHPFDGDHILTIGEDGDEWGSSGGVVLQLFDISDFANPSLAFRQVVAEGWGASSEAMYDHKAFLYYSPDNLMAVPVKNWNWDDWGDDDWWDDDVDDDDWGDDDDVGETEPGGGNSGDAPTFSDEAPPDDAAYSGVYLYNVTGADGFNFLGYIDHSDYQAEAGSDYFGDLPTVRRCVVIGDYLYTISDAALAVTEIDGVSDLTSDDLPYSEERGWWGDDDDWWDDDIDWD